MNDLLGSFFRIATITEKITARILLHAAMASAGGEPEMRFLCMQTALDILDSGLGLDDDATEFSRLEGNLTGIRNFQQLTGLRPRGFLGVPTAEEVSALGRALLQDQ